MVKIVWCLQVFEVVSFSENEHGTLTPTKYHSFLCFYGETGDGQYVLRNLMVDLELNVIDDVKSSKLH